MLKPSPQRKGLKQKDIMSSKNHVFPGMFSKEKSILQVK